MTPRLIIAGLIVAVLLGGAWRIWSISSELSTLRAERVQGLAANARLVRELSAQAESHQRALDAVQEAAGAEVDEAARAADIVARIRNTVAAPLSPSARVFLEGARQ